MALVARFPASLRGLNAPSPRGAFLVRAARNQQQRSLDVRSRFGLERAERHKIPRNAPAQRHNFTSTPKPSVGGSTHEFAAHASASAQDVRDPLRVIAPKAQVDATSRCCPYSDAWHKEMLCTIQASALRRLSIISHFFYSVLSVRFACIAVGGSVRFGAVQPSRALRKRRPPRSARHQTTRCRSKCAGTPCDHASL